MNRWSKWRWSRYPRALVRVRRLRRGVMLRQYRDPDSGRTWIEEVKP